MIYLSCITFPGGSRETDYLLTFGGSSYPYHVISSFGLKKMTFEPITILSGSNGSGKSTLLHLLAETVNLPQESSSACSAYAHICDAEISHKIPKNSRMMTSDDVFDNLLEIRCLNKGSVQKREELCQEYLTAKYAHFQFTSLTDYEELKKVVKSRSITQRQFVRDELIEAIKEYSNGETAFRYFIEKIGHPGLFLLDEPENSLSPGRQLELKQLVEDAARFFRCQFVISTHSPFLLAMSGARIYDLDEKPAAVKRWADLENVRLYRDFFQLHQDEFS